MEKKSKANDRNKSISKTKSKLKQKTCRRSKVEIEKSDIQKNELQKLSISNKDESISMKPKYDFSDDSSENELNLINDSSNTNLKESDLKWQGKSVQLKEMKARSTVSSDGYHEKNPSTDDSLLSSDFLSCFSSITEEPTVYRKRNKSNYESLMSMDNHHDTEATSNHKLNSVPQFNEYDESSYTSPTYGNSPLFQEGKLMSEDSEAFFWDWILKK